MSDLNETLTAQLSEANKVIEGKWISVKDQKPKTGVYPAVSDWKERDDVKKVNSGAVGWLDILYHYDGEENKWQHISGAYDEAISHYLAEIPLMPPPPNPPKVRD